jgi:hypothetical protein
MAVGIDEFWSNLESHRAWQVATTGLACMALSELEQTPQTVAAYERGIDFLIERADKVKRPSDWDVDNTWGYLYGLQALAQAAPLPRFQDAPRHEALRQTVRGLIEKLRKYQSPDGGWGYYDTFDTVTMPPAWSTSFMTAAAILALLDARQAGFDVPDAMLKPAVQAVKRCRLPNGAYAYSVDPVPSPGRLEWINQVKGSLGRIQVCNLALLRAGEPISTEQLETGMQQFFEHHRFLDIARLKPIPHEAYYYNSGYFYFFGHYYAAGVIEALPAEKRAEYWSKLQNEILKTQEANGSMWDYQMASYTRPYGTAFGLLTLTRSIAERPVTDAPPPASAPSGG